MPARSSRYFPRASKASSVVEDEEHGPGYAAMGTSTPPASGRRQRSRVTPSPAMEKDRDDEEEEELVLEDVLQDYEDMRDAQVQTYEKCLLYVASKAGKAGEEEPVLLHKIKEDYDIDPDEFLFEAAFQRCLQSGELVRAKKRRFTVKAGLKVDPPDTNLVSLLLSAPPQHNELELKKIKYRRSQSDNFDAEDLSSIDGDRGSDDEDEEDDRPYQVEYSVSAAATCRTCDEKIKKSELRIGHRPLFRGKPGFVVYRHLYCATFEDHITDFRQLGGWRGLLTEHDRNLVQQRIQESKEEIEKENQELDANELVQASFTGTLRPPPPGLDEQTSLLPFQKEGLSWMVCQEVQKKEIRGGILADEMGMGKTIQTIATILDHRPRLQHSLPGAKHPPSATAAKKQLLVKEEGLWEKAANDWEHEMKMCNVPPHLLSKSARAGTLVVCPVIALSQWKAEIEKFTQENALTVGVYHGTNRASEMPPELMCKYDIVLTTYQVIEADFRKMVSPNKVKCPNCGGAFKVDKLRVHLKYFCGEGAKRTVAQARQRRSADRQRAEARGPRGGKRPPQTKKQKVFKTETKKKVIRLKGSVEYDSDSELSLVDSSDDAEPVKSPSGRPARRAATTATKRLNSSRLEWGGNQKDGGSSDGDESSVQFSSEGDDDDDSSVSSLRRAPTRRASANNNASKKKKAVVIDDSDDESDAASDSSSEDEPLIKIASKKGRRTQTKRKMTKTKTKKAPGKTPAAKRRNTPTPSERSSDEDSSSDDDLPKKTTAKRKIARKKQTPAKPLTGKRKKPPLPDESSSDDESVGDHFFSDDPMAGIDLEKLMAEAMAGSRASVIHTMTWWRVVLDEAHMIKSRSSQTAAAAFALTSVHRWCLSGTPLQNRVGELYSLIRFLRIDPMAHYICKKEGCSCKSIHYRMLHGKCRDCGHSSIQHYSHFNKHVLNPIQRDGYKGDGRRAMLKLKSQVLDRCLLRRTKQTRAEDINLPPRVVTIRPVRLHPREEDFYNALYMQTKSNFDDFVAEGTLLNNYSHIFDLLSRMRQAVDHPYLIVHSKKNAAEAKMSRNNKSRPVANGSVDCEICNDPPVDRIVSLCCGAAFCRACAENYMDTVIQNSQGQVEPKCPGCAAPFSINLSQKGTDLEDDGVLTTEFTNTTGKATDGMPSLKEMSHVASGSILRRINLAEFSTSTKMEALVQELVQMRQERPGSKALVFSQFVNMLDLVRWRLHSDPCLHDLGIGVRIIHGGMNAQSRDEALKDFREDPSVRVLLMSLKAGGVALNLTVANEAYLLDPWWNPAAEMQAIDRTHRMGQYRPIRAIRFIAEGTVEERVLQLQEKKRLVFDGTVGRDAASLKMLTVDDMKALFA